MGDVRIDRGMMGNAEVNPAIQPKFSWHDDEATRAESKLQLA